MFTTQKQLIDGNIGPIEVAVDYPNEYKTNTSARGIAMVAHPHPLFGGTMDNKVAQTLAKTFAQLGYIAVRANFRGVGQTAGIHDAGAGETDDTLTVIRWAQQQFSASLRSPALVLSGFSFGTLVQSQVAPRLIDAGETIARMVFIGTAAGKWAVGNIPRDSIVIHGELDETIPLTDVLRWAEPQELPITVIAGADHFFHRRLHLLRQFIEQQWSPE